VELVEKNCGEKVGEIFHFFHQFRFFRLFLFLKK
jgi:hypothetical protein